MAANRMSTHSGSSTPTTGFRTTLGQHSTQVSTTTLLNALHTTYTSAQPYRLDASTSVVVNTWLTAANSGVDGRQGGTVDVELARQAWEHARRRAEDGCVVLGYVLYAPVSSIAKAYLFQVSPPLNPFVAISFYLGAAHSCTNNPLYCTFRFAAVYKHSLAL